MADTRKIIKVFLASPGDLQDERRAAKSVADLYFNELWADQTGYQVELVGWEDTVSTYGRPQATINHDLEQCELFVGMLWRHWGTPPDLSGRYSSGFEEEFTLSVESRQRCGRPEISLFFKNVDEDLLLDPGEGLKKVIAFRERVIAEKAIYFEVFDNLANFERKFLRCITRYVQRLQQEEASKLSDVSQARPLDDTAPQNLTQIASPSDASPPETPLSVEGATFLREFISKTERDVEQEPVTSVEVARFRLLSNIIWVQGNDEQTLGVHDANILFANRDQLTFSSRELRGLIVSGLQHFSSENAPLWHWLAADDGLRLNMLPLYSFILSSAEQGVGALLAMRLISEPLFFPPPPDRSTYLDSWLSKDGPRTLKVAALGYLGDCGIPADLPAIKAELDRGDYQTTSAAIDAILRINLRDSCEKAIRALLELQPASVNQGLLDTLFEDGASIDANFLSQGIGHKSAEVRRISVKLLRERGALDVEAAERLTTDSDAGVRLEALESLLAAGKSFSDGEAKKVLVKSTATKAFGLFGLGGTDSAGESCLALFRKQRLEVMSIRDLEQLASRESIFDRAAGFVLAERQFATSGHKLRKSVDDKFQSEFANALNKMAGEFSGASDLIERTRAIEEHVRKNLTRQALDVICRKGGPNDLNRVREILRSGFVAYSNADVEYLRKFGEWEDIALIVESIERPDSGHTSLLISNFDDAKYRTAARAVYSLGRKRLAELLTLRAPGRLLLHIIMEASDAEFRALSDPAIAQLFRLEAVVRKVAALKCVLALPKKRLTQLLRNYLRTEESHYYNVIHWLDFGISLPFSRSRPAASSEMKRQ